MAEEFGPGCQRPAIKKKGSQPVSNGNQLVAKEKEENKIMLKVGGAAPDFTAPAFFEGKFMNISLSEYLGKWVLLCFYPGDFTFV